MIRALLLAACLFAAGPAVPQSGPAPAAATEQFTFDVRFGGVRVARLLLAARDDGAAYALAGRAESTGLVAVFRALRFEMEAAGAWSGGRPRAARYAENVDTGRRASVVGMAWADGVPRIASAVPAEPAPYHADPADHPGTTDPLSTLWRLVRPRDEDSLCSWSEAVFDGRRRSSLALGAPRAEGEAVSCPGLYTRIDGFAPEEMAERTEFPFTATFAPGADGLWRMVRLDLRSLYGPVRITPAAN